MLLEFKICSLFSESFPQLSLCLESHNPSVYGSCTTRKVRYSLEHLKLSGINVIFLMCFFLLCVSGGTHIVSIYAGFYSSTPEEKETESWKYILTEISNLYK